MATTQGALTSVGVLRVFDFESRFSFIPNARD